jgi:glycosyltransferase involved in cell wall biosynthesis
VGGGRICADLCSNFYPLITVGTVPSSIAVSEGQFVLTGKQITSEDREYAARLGFAENYLQSCLFTSSINPQTGKAARQQYGIPEDAFVILIVGGRLDEEVTEDFIEQVLLPVLEQKGVVAVFMGAFDRYQERCDKYPLLGVRSVYTGFVEDVLSVNEICDVYVNPQRYGGGTSVVEAMAKKVPPVTLNYGDVALGTGEDFWVKDYEAMVQQILRLKDDEAFYQMMSEKAYERMKVVTDTSAVFWNTFEKIRRLPEFQ